MSVEFKLLAKLCNFRNYAGKFLLCFLYNKKMADSSDLILKKRKWNLPVFWRMKVEAPCNHHGNMSYGVYIVAMLTGCKNFTVITDKR